MPEHAVGKVHSDPGFVGAFNRYWYANNNPYRFTDPDGRTVGEMTDSGAEGCGAVSCAGWAVRSATWQVFGAEGISKIADDGWSNTGTGDHVSAGIEVLGALPFAGVAKGAGTVIKGGIEAVRVGQAGETAVRAVANIGEKAAITVGSRTRIPDGLTSTVLSEVKNVKSLSYTQQLRDFAQFSHDAGLRFDLYIRQDTKISGPLQDAIDQGIINRLDIPK